ncbi:hypothetical protein JW921_09560 [Candidatus Fermentibacterales bacterium]|nr:hypothetical protein [Candidatus Fermentibacterales bacterium]
MLEGLAGRVTEVGDCSFTMQIGGMSLQILAPAFFARTIRPGTSIEVRTYFVLQQEGNRVTPVVAGFESDEDRAFFLRFISVSGVGTRAAIRALVRPCAEVATAIAAGDVDFLTGLPGIGAARARKIIASLQEELKRDYPSLPASGGAESGSYSEAVCVLVQLGVPRSEACSLVSAAIEELGCEAASSVLVKRAMQSRSRR